MMSFPPLPTLIPTCLPQLLYTFSIWNQIQSSSTRPFAVPPLTIWDLSDGTVQQVDSYLAAVCPECRRVPKPVALHTLDLSPTRLETPGFINMINDGRDLDLVRKMNLFAPLAEYDCPECESYTTKEELLHIRAATGFALRRTFALLSTWRPSVGRLLLDITPHTASDARHYFLHLETDSLNQNITIVDTDHGWGNAERAGLPLPDATVRAFQNIAFQNDFWGALPDLSAVTALSLRRQATQQWAPSSVLKIIGKLSGVRELHYELWREWERENTGSADRSKSSPANTHPGVHYHP
jgi:hypothetical protein